MSNVERLEKLNRIGKCLMIWSRWKLVPLDTCIKDLYNRLEYAKTNNEHVDEREYERGEK